MKAVIIKQYGSADQLQLAEMKMPALKPKEVLIKNHYTSINPMDTQVRGGKFKLFAGRKFPKILGVESAGIVEEVGSEVTAFKKGDRVMASLGFNFGTYAEFTKVNEKSVFSLPNDITFQEGATLTMAACTAYNSLYLLGEIKLGDEVLINGAYGGIGTFAVQLAKIAGARVTGVCSTANVKNVKALQADHVIEYNREDVYTGEKQYDIVFDTVGKMNAGKVMGILKKGGKMINTVASFKQVLFSVFVNLFSSKKIKTVWNAPTAEQMSFLVNWVSEHKLKVIIDREYPLSELADAHKYSETGKAKGKILIKI